MTHLPHAVCGSCTQRTVDVRDVTFLWLHPPINRKPRTFRMTSSHSCVLVALCGRRNGRTDISRGHAPQRPALCLGSAQLRLRSHRSSEWTLRSNKKDICFAGGGFITCCVNSAPRHSDYTMSSLLRLCVQATDTTAVTVQLINENSAGAGWLPAWAAKVFTERRGVSRNTFCTALAVHCSVN